MPDVVDALRVLAYQGVAEVTGHRGIPKQPGHAADNDAAAAARARGLPHPADALVGIDAQEDVGAPPFGHRQPYLQVGDLQCGTPPAVNAAQPGRIIAPSHVAGARRAATGGLCPSSRTNPGARWRVRVLAAVVSLDGRVKFPGICAFL